MIRSVAHWLVSALAVRGFKRGRLRIAKVFGAYSDDSGEGAFLAIELRARPLLTLGVRIPGRRAMECATHVIQAAGIGTVRHSPLEVGEREHQHVMADLERMFEASPSS